MGVTMVGKRVVELRKLRGISTNKLANLAGISQSYLREIELCQKNPTIEILSYICDALNVSLPAFFEEDKSEINPLLLSAIQKLSPKEQIKLAEFINIVKSDS